MGYLVLPIGADGVLTSASIRPPAADELRGFGTPRTFTALIDTGADVTAISPAAVARVGFRRFGSIFVNRVGGPVPARLFAARLKIGPLQTTSEPWMDLDVVEAPLASPGVDILIGRDVLSRASLLYDGPRGFCLLLT